MLAALFLACLALAGSSVAAALPQSDNNDNGGNNGADTNAGASGKSTSFSLGTGAIAAIVIVVVIVVVFGIASTVLWVEAKRRNETMRATLIRASRRLTGRFSSKPAAAADRRSRRTGLHMSSVPGSQSHKRGLVVQVTDVEKAQRGGGPAKAGRS